MSDKTPKSFFMLPPVVRYAGFYQELLSGIVTYQQLGNRLISLGEHAHALRQFDKVKEIGLILSNIPIKSYQSIGHYFLGVAANCNGNGKQQEAKRLFELVADTAPLKYRAKAILSLAGVSANMGDYDSELYFFIESLKASQDVSTSLISYRGIAVHKAREGYHSHALDDLEKLLPLTKYAPSLVSFDYLNSYAVELGEAGRLHEAENISSLVVASPLVHYYPEWRETFSEVRSKRKSRSTVAVGKPFTTDKLITVDEFFDEPAEQPKARILTFPTQEPEDWKLEQEPELEPEPESQAGASSSIEGFLFGEFNIRDKIEDWAHGVIDIDDLGILAIALVESEDEAEKDLIASRLVDTIFTYSSEAKEAKEKWYEKLLARMKLGD